MDHHDAERLNPSKKTPDDWKSSSQDDSYATLVLGAALGKNTSAVRETSASRHNGGKLRACLKPLGTIVSVVFEGFQEAINSAPMMPRDASIFAGSL